MASATASNVIRSQSLKSHLCLVLCYPYWYRSLIIFHKNCCLLLKSASFWPEKGHLDRNSFFSTKIMLLRTKNSSFCEKLSKFCINRANKNKSQMWFWRLASNHIWGCSRGNLWLIWIRFSDNVGMTLVFIWYSHQKFLRPPSSPQTAHLKCLKTYWLPCR